MLKSVEVRGERSRGRMKVQDGCTSSRRYRGSESPRSGSSQKAAQLQLLGGTPPGDKPAQQTPPTPPHPRSIPSISLSQLAQATWPQGGCNLLMQVSGVGGQRGQSP